MAIERKRPLGINVVKAARRRIKNIFSNGVKVHLNSSGGKDSIVLCHLVYEMCVRGEIDKSLLEVDFIDEEVIYDEVVRICKDWRTKFEMIGVPYKWFCIEHRNNNCFNSLENNENFIPWDRFEKANWAREMPKFAIRTNRYHVPRTESYQEFLDRNNKDGITIVGVRTAESRNRQQYIATINRNEAQMTVNNMAYPIYDWKDSDVWKYIRDNNIDFPDVYIKMYEAGLPKHNLRVCNFMAIDTASSLTAMAEAYPDLWEKVLRREPNAYLVRLYWDTEMFHRTTKRRKELEGGTEVDATEYRAKVMDMVNNPHKWFKNKHALMLAGQYKQFVIKFGGSFDGKMWREVYEGMLGGDTKGRTLRALITEASKRGFEAMEAENG